MHEAKLLETNDWVVEKVENWIADLVTKNGLIILNNEWLFYGCVYNILLV